MVVNIDYKTYNKFDNFFTIDCFSLKETKRAITIINGLKALNHISDLYVSTMKYDEAITLLTDVCSLYETYGDWDSVKWNDEAEQKYQQFNFMFNR